MPVSRIALTPEGPELSRLLYGCWRLGDDPEGSGPARVRAKIERCLELGITSFDHADIYGDYTCEALFGAALAEAPELRARIELVSKCGICLVSEARPEHRVKHYDTRPDHVRASVERSLENLRTDYLDLLLIHRPDPFCDYDELGQVLSELQAAGTVRAVGVSNFTPGQLELLAARCEVPLVTNQIELSVLHPEPLIDGTLDACQRLPIRAMAWSPLGGGRLFSGDDPQAQRVRAALQSLAEAKGCGVDTLAYAWLLAHPARVLPVIGTNKLARIEAAAAACDVTLEQQEWYQVYEAALGAEVP